MKNTYKVDFVNNTLTMTKAFEDAASNPTSQEYKLLQQIRADFPGLTIIRKTRRAPKKARHTKNLTYANMEKYMSVFKNSVELLAQFEVVKECSKQQPSPYQVCAGLVQGPVPQLQGQPDFSNNTSKVIDLETIKKKQEEKKQQESA
jgi:hypothetical protein